MNAPNYFWQDECEHGENIDHKLARKLMRGVLKRALYHAMHDHLHWLATHWFAAGHIQKEAAPEASDAKG